MDSLASALTVSQLEVEAASPPCRGLALRPAPAGITSPHLCERSRRSCFTLTSNNGAVAS